MTFSDDTLDGFRDLVFDDSMRYYFQLYEKVEIDCIPGDACFVCVAAMASDVGLFFWPSSTAALTTPDNFSSSSLCATMVDVRSATKLRARGGSRCQFMWRFQSLESPALEEGGSSLAPVTTVGDPKV